MGSRATGSPAIVGQSGSLERLSGEVVTVDEASGTVGIKLNETVGSGDRTAATTFKVQDGLVFNAIKPGEKVSFGVERVGGELRITDLRKE
jgi:Cu/Ag efflux protein CusF